MERYKVIGVINKTGEYQGVNYNNMLFHCTYEDETAINGLMTDVIKVKTFKLKECFGCEIDDEFLEMLVGEEIYPLYNKYGAVDKIQILEESKENAEEKEDTENGS